MPLNARARADGRQRLTGRRELLCADGAGRRERRHVQLTCEETFGPVAALFRFDTEDEAVDAANDTPFGRRVFLHAGRAAHRARRRSSKRASSDQRGALASEAAVRRREGIGYGREGSRYGLTTTCRSSIVSGRAGLTGRARAVREGGLALPGLKACVDIEPIGSYNAIHSWTPHHCETDQWPIPPAWAAPANSNWKMPRATRWLSSGTMDTKRVPARPDGRHGLSRGSLLAFGDKKALLLAALDLYMAERQPRTSCRNPAP